MEKGLYEHIKQFMRAGEKVPKSNDPLGKLRPFINLINSNFKKHYNPDEFLVVDEGVIKIDKKPVNMKQESPPQCFKEYVLCDGLRSYTLEVKFMPEQEFNQRTRVNHIRW
jgi:hypothetical protein